MDLVNTPLSELTLSMIGWGMFKLFLILIAVRFVIGFFEFLADKGHQ